jgi:hypothetical protein
VVTNIGSTVTSEAIKRALISPGQGMESVTTWDFAPSDVKDEVTRLEQTEEVKSWMALGSRDKSALMTLPQLIRVIDVAWKDGFDDLIRDKALLQEARVIAHLRNTLCHMSNISKEETHRIKRTSVTGLELWPRNMMTARSLAFCRLASLRDRKHPIITDTPPRCYSA